MTGFGDHEPLGEVGVVRSGTERANLARLRAIESEVAAAGTGVVSPDPGSNSEPTPQILRGVKVQWSLLVLEAVAQDPVTGRDLVEVFFGLHPLSEDAEAVRSLLAQLATLGYIRRRGSHAGPQGAIPKWTLAPAGVTWMEERRAQVNDQLYEAGYPVNGGLEHAPEDPAVTYDASGNATPRGEESLL